LHIVSYLIAKRYTGIRPNLHNFGADQWLIKRKLETEHKVKGMCAEYDITYLNIFAETAMASYLTSAPTKLATNEKERHHYVRHIITI